MADDFTTKPIQQNQDLQVEDLPKQKPADVAKKPSPSELKHQQDVSKASDDSSFNHQHQDIQSKARQLSNTPRDLGRKIHLNRPYEPHAETNKQFREKQFQASRSERKETTREKEGFLAHSSRTLKNLKSEEGESRFESSLKKALTGEEKLPGQEESRLQLPEKTAAQWEDFFKNVLNQGTLEQASTMDTDQIMEALFRGHYQTGEQAQTLVSDLGFLNENNNLTYDKFSRILVDNPELQVLLEQMQPGDRLSSEFIKKLGYEINYLKLAHDVKAPTAESKKLASEAALGVLKSPMNFAALAQVERFLSEDRNRMNEEKRKSLLNSENEPLPLRNPYWGGFFSSESEKKKDKPRFWLFFSSIITFTIIAILAYILFRAFK